MATFYREQVTAPHSALGDAKEADRAQASERLRSLVSKIALTPKDGSLAIDVHGDLAGNLGEFDDAVILKSFGDVPEDFRQV